MHTYTITLNKNETYFFRLDFLNYYLYFTTIIIKINYCSFNSNGWSEIRTRGPFRGLLSQVACFCPLSHHILLKRIECNFILLNKITSY